jgi:hypothetical protein
MKPRSILAVLVSASALVLPATASAATTTIGSIVEPAGGVNLTDCTSAVAVLGQTPSTYTVGAGGGIVTSWSVNATGDGTGTETLYVLAPSGSGYTVVGLDAEALPAKIPAGGTVTFTLATPILAASGDTFGLSATGSGSSDPVYCAWSQGDIPASDEVFAEVGVDPTVGQTVTPTPLSQGGPLNNPNALLDLAVTLSPGSEDAAVTTMAGPKNAVVGNEALLSSTVTNNGPFAGPTTFTDAVPAGLAVSAVAAAGGSCTTTGQLVSCTFASLAVGASELVEIVVAPAAAGTYENSVSVADETGVTDPNPSNNTSSATLTVGSASALSSRACVTTSVKGLSEKVVKRLLPSFGCKVGKIKKATSKSVAKGDVISLTPGSGAHAPGTKVTITVSSGKRKPKKHKS